jgi:glutamate/tyrosine decarboxylase-like PLP-dependent enzyme
MSDDSPLIDFYPYRARFKTYERLAPDGRDRQSILDELATMAHEEDRIADLGHVSGSIYHGGHDHYAFLTEAFKLFGVLLCSRHDMYPSATKLEAEIVAMTASVLHAEEPFGVVTGGTGEPHQPDARVSRRGRARITRPG